MKNDEMMNSTTGIPTEFNQYSVSGTSPYQTSSDYAPKNAPKSEKKSGSSGKKTIAAVCAACVILSGACGFGGTLLANRMTASAPAAETTVTQSETKDPTLNAPVVVYKSAETVNAASGTTAAHTSGDELTYAQVAALVKDSVVEINTEYTTRNAWFQYTTGGAGSGVILTEDGYIITNAHVILDQNMQNVADTVTVRLTDGTEYKAEVKSYDTDEDIAVLKIDAKGLTPAKCGDSSTLVTGQEVLVVGNPLGELGGSVSNGIVSATEREIQVGGVTMHLIQTNAAVNPGNSGGGMFNMKGELVGIVNAKSSGTGIEGLGFAIPVNQALAVSEELMTKGYVSGKPMIGVSLEDVSNGGEFSFFFGSNSGVKPGVYVKSLVEGMNDKVLKEGDRIIAVNGDEISSSDDVKAAVSASSVGDKLTFQLYRDGKLMEVEVTVFERTPDVKTAASTNEDKSGEAKEEKKEQTTKPAIGVSLTESAGGAMKAGVYVAALEEGMNDKVLKVGDRIVAINGDEITSVEDVRSIVQSSEIGDKLTVQVSREGKLVSVEVTVFEMTVDENASEEASENAPEEEQSGLEDSSGFGGLADLFGSFFGGGR